MSGRITTVDMLRGLAALAVCWFHVTNGNRAFLPNGVLKGSGSYGWLGVHVFFVISGFIIPYAMYRAEYRLANVGRFLCKRIVRLDPPYFAAIALVIGLAYASSWAPGFRGLPFHWSWKQFIAHLGYANAFFHYPWYNVVFWTLAIEFQFYLVISVAFPLIRRPGIGSIAVLGTMLALSLLVPNESLICRYFALFALGIVTFQFVTEQIRIVHYFAASIVICLVGLVALGPLMIMAGALAAVCIAFINWRSRVLLFLGTISYSLYLTHAPVGGRVINIAERFATGPVTKFAAVLTALVVSVGFAYVFYRFIEAPAQRWASKIRYGARAESAKNGNPEQPVEMRSI